MPLRSAALGLALAINRRHARLQPMSVRCTVRPYVADDWTDHFEAVTESETRLMNWMPWCHVGYTEQESRDWIRTTIEGHITGTMFDFAVFDTHGRFAGACGLNQIRSNDRYANLGYWIRTSACGQGLAGAAALRVGEWAFANTNLNRLEILVAVGNTASQRVAQKLNAHYEGRLRSRVMLHGDPTDAHLYSIVRSDLPQSMFTGSTST